MTEADIRADLESEIRLAGSAEGGAANLLQEHARPNLECAINLLLSAICAESTSERCVELLRAADDLRALRCRIDRCLEAVDAAAGHAVVRHSAGVA